MHPKLMDWEGERVPKINEIWMLACIKNSLKNTWFRRPKFNKITKKMIPKTMYFLHAFLNRLWRGLGRVPGATTPSDPGPAIYLTPRGPREKGKGCKHPRDTKIQGRLHRL